MKLHPRNITILLLFLNISISCLSQKQLKGDWVGGIETLNTYILIKVKFIETKNGIKGKLDIDAPPPFLSGSNLPLGKIMLVSDTVFFDFMGFARFRGLMQKDSIYGTFTSPQGVGTFKLVPTIKIYPHLLDKYAGIYKTGTGNILYIRKNHFGGISYNNYNTGEFKMLFPSSDFSFFGGPSNKIPFPKKLFVSFTSSGKYPVELKASEKGTRGIVARQVQLVKEEDVVFNRDTIKLAGTLLLPIKKGTHPAIVFISQSTSPSSYKSLYSLAIPFAAKGIAVLLYDKRGNGGSTGDWRNQTTEDFANDVIAGIDFLKSKSNIDTTKIGLYAQSQGGMIAPLVVNKSKDVAFIVAVSPVCLSVHENAVFTLKKQLESENFSPEQIAEAVKFQVDINDFAASKISWDSYIKARKSFQNKQWFSYVTAPSKPEDKTWNLLKENFDPSASWQNVNIPVLALFGGTDIYMDALKSKENLQKNLIAGGNEKHTIKFYPEGDHGLREAKIGNLKESPYLKRYVYGFHSLITDWVLLNNTPLRK